MNVALMLSQFKAQQKLNQTRDMQALFAHVSHLFFSCSLTIHIPIYIPFEDANASRCPKSKAQCQAGCTHYC